jgi:hypothetical protein
MRSAARIAGIIWIAAAVLMGIAFEVSGIFRGGRLDMIILFGVALPGIFLWRWGKGLKPRLSIQQRSMPVRRPPLEPADESHIMRLD